MPRSGRVVVPGAPHHVVQRGNRRQRTFFGDADYQAYLDLAGKAFAEAGVEVWAYCLMPNHVHLVVTPSTADGLTRAVASTHAKYTRRINEREGCAGFLWQGRFASSPMDEVHCVRCLRYVALNPVRAGLVREAAAWRWSSVQAHLGMRTDPLVATGVLEERLDCDLHAFFQQDADEEARLALRRAAVTGRPLGSTEWLRRHGLA